MADIKIHDCAQRTPEWVALRVAKITATDGAALMSKPPKSGGETAGKADLRMRLVVERVTGRPAEDGGFVSAAMQWGIDHEDEAFAAYEARTGQLVDRVGFVERADLPCGCSPDGILGADPILGGIELKCPKSTTHLGYLNLRGKVPSEYRWQLVHTLWVTGAPYWDFVSFDPRFPEPLQLYVTRFTVTPEAMAEYDAAVRAFLADVDKAHADFLEMLEGRR